MNKKFLGTLCWELFLQNIFKFIFLGAKVEKHFALRFCRSNDDFRRRRRRRRCCQNVVVEALVDGDVVGGSRRRRCVRDVAVQVDAVLTAGLLLKISF